MAYRGGDVHGLYVVAVSERDPADPAAGVPASTSASSAIVSTVAAGTATSTHRRGSSDASPTPVRVVGPQHRSAAIAISCVEFYVAQWARPST
jgi:hypothetical protein